VASLRNASPETGPHDEKTTSHDPAEANTQESKLPNSLRKILREFGNSMLSFSLLRTSFGMEFSETDSASPSVLSGK